MSNLSGATTAVFIVSLSAALEVPVTVAWKTKDGTAKAGTDYEAASGSVTFEPGETTKQIQVAIYGRAEGDTETRTFSIELYPPENAILDQTLTEVKIQVVDESGAAVTSLIVATGPRGLKGDPGLSSYELAKLQGFTGTLEDYIAQETAAGAAVGLAQQQVSRAANEADRSRDEADRSDLAANRAESIVDVNGTYPDTAAGLAATTNGQYFRVPQGIGGSVSFLYYRNNAGVAQPVADLPSRESIVLALSQYFDGSNPDVLFGLKDVLNRVFGWWDLSGKYNGDLAHARWDDDGRMFADLAVIGDMHISLGYQNPDVATYFIDASGRVLFEVPLVESEANENEQIEAINTRLDASMRTDGIIKSEFFGLNFLSETRRCLMLAAAKEGQFVINIIGNSWVHNEWNLPRRLTQVLQDRFGDAGAGFAGYNRNFAHPGRAFLTVVSGTWTEETVTNPTATNFGPAGSQGKTSTAGATIAFQSLTGDTSAAIYHNADSSVSPVIKIKYKDNVSGASTEETQLTLSGTGVTRTELPSPPVTGNWTATLTLFSGTLAFCGIELKKSVPGIRVNKLGTGGSTWRQWTTLNRDGWVQGITPLAANLNILLESVNGAYSYDADAEAGYTTEMASRVRDASAFSDVLIISPPQTLGTPTYSLRDFAYKLRGIAGSLKAGHVDLQPVFGQSLSDYNDSGKKYILAADVNHPTFPAGQCVISETVLRAILSAF